jgi:hypothetical protein
LPRELTAQFSATQVRPGRNIERDQKAVTDNVYVRRREGKTYRMLLLSSIKEIQASFGGIQVFEEK